MKTCEKCGEEFVGPYRLDLMRRRTVRDTSAVEDRYQKVEYFRVASLNVDVRVCYACGATPRKVVRASAPRLVENAHWNWIEFIASDGEMMWEPPMTILQIQKDLEEGLNAAKARAARADRAG